MKPLLVAAFVGIAALAQLPAAAAPQSSPVAQTYSVAAQTYHGGTIIHRICSPGYSWQYGCLKWGPTPPGKLFGVCVKQGWGCFRDKQPIQ